MNMRKLTCANHAQVCSKDQASKLHYIWSLINKSRVERRFTIAPKQARMIAIAFLARYCELERQYLTERGVL